MVMKQRWFLVLAAAMMFVIMTAGLAMAGPRFTDNNNGTVTDNLTGLIWLKNANCFGLKTWVDALILSSNLASGNCGLTDGSKPGDWRLPSEDELLALLDFWYHGPALSNTAGTGQWTEGDPFTGVQSLYYWSSTIGARFTGYVWLVTLWDGHAAWYSTDNNFYVWPVRGQSGTFGNLDIPNPVLPVSVPSVSIKVNHDGMGYNPLPRYNDETTLSSPVSIWFDVENFWFGDTCKEIFLILNAPVIGVNWSYLNDKGRWIPFPQYLDRITPFGCLPKDGQFLIYSGDLPPGDYDLYIGINTLNEGHLDLYNSGLTYDHLMIHVVN